jgi:hypothetical protein
MTNVSRPLIALLIGTVAFFAVWIVALKPSPSTSTAGGGPGLGSYQGAINSAHNAVSSSKAAARAVETASATSTPAVTSTPAATSTPATAPTATTPAVAASTTAPPARVRLNAVQHALKAHKVVALLFYNPAAADDVAVKHELAAIATHKGAVIKVSVPLTELSRYTTVTNQVQVQYSPTLVLIDRHARATTIVGFTDTFEIANRIDNALAGR